MYNVLNEIVVVGDVHEGRTYDIRVDTLTGVSARAMDLHNNLVRAAKYAVDIKASLFVLLGDVFDRTNVAPIFREYVRQDVIEPLGEAGVKVFILAGNHDQPRVFQRGTSIDDFSGYPHVSIFRRPSCVVQTIAGRKICFIVMPFLYPDSLLDQAGKAAQEIAEDQKTVVSQEILKEFLQKNSKTDADARILLAHYYFEGAEVSNTQYPEAEMGEVEFTPSMIPENLDLALFGHVHLHQTKEARGVPIIIAGALERIDWGERQNEKGFLVVDPANMKPEFHQLPTREMLEIQVKVEAGDKDPTRTILDEIPSELNDKMVRLIVELPSGMRPLIHADKIAEKVAPSFDYREAWTQSASEIARLTDVSKGLPGMYDLLDSFIEESFAKHPRKEALIREGKSILKEALEE